MSLSYEIDSEHKLVIARAHGVLTYKDISDYQAEVWTCPEVIGFDEIIDVSAVEQIDYHSPRQVGELAARSANMECERETRLAIVAPDYGSYGLARMYQTYRGLQANSKKKVAVLRSFEEASMWIASERRLAPQSRSLTEKTSS